MPYRASYAVYGNVRYLRNRDNGFNPSTRLRRLIFRTGNINSEMPSWIILNYFLKLIRSLEHRGSAPNWKTCVKPLCESLYMPGSLLVWGPETWCLDWNELQALEFQSFRLSLQKSQLASIVAKLLQDSKRSRQVSQLCNRTSRALNQKPFTDKWL